MHEAMKTGPIFCTESLGCTRAAKDVCVYTYVNVAKKPTDNPRESRTCTL